MKIRAKKGYNLILKDIGLNLKAEQREWTEISEEDYNNSLDIKSFSKYIEVYNSNNKDRDLSKSNDLIDKKETVFVKEGRVYSNPSDTFVRYEEEDVIDDIKDDIQIPEEVKTNEQDTTIEVVEKENVELKPEEKVKKQHKNNKQKGNKKDINDSVIEEIKNIDITVK